MYDEECEKLAEYFLHDTAARDDKTKIAELAQHIQTEIESWLEGNDL